MKLLIVFLFAALSVGSGAAWSQNPEDELRAGLQNALKNDAARKAKKKSGPIQLSECQRPGMGRNRCFSCAYAEYRDHSVFEMSPAKACDFSNRLCGTHKRCGGCGPGPDPDPSKTTISSCLFFKSEIYRKGKWFHTSSCGGKETGADKLAHCWAFCTFTSCFGPELGHLAAWKWARDYEFDDEDNQANRIGIDVARQTLTEGCFSTCVRETYDLHFD